MKTSYEGCHPKIAESLKRGEHIECLVWDVLGDEFERVVVGFVAGEEEPYIAKNKYAMEFYSWTHARPIPKKETRVIGPVLMMQRLKTRGYTVNADGAWWPPIVGPAGVVPNMWQYCGNEPSRAWEWEPWMLKEVEVE